LPGQRQFGVMAAFSFENHRVGQELFHVGARQFFETQ
jgi:hypothetical protein